MFYRYFLRSFLRVYLVLIRFLKWIGPAKKPLPASSKGVTLLLTGSFYSENWIAAHLRPLSLSPYFHRIMVVSVFPIPRLPNVEVIYPSKWLIKLFGDVPARLILYFWVGVTRRPDIVGGFHLLFNGLAACLLAHLIGVRSLYNCGGGAMEVAGGGILSENKLFSRLPEPDSIIEKDLLRVVNFFDYVITRGEKTNRYFRDNGVTAKTYIVTGGINGRSYSPVEAEPVIDLIFVGRLSPVKRLHLFIEAVNLLRGEFPQLSAVLVGEGSERASLEELVRELDLAGNIKFAGLQRNIQEWLQKSKIFILTSETEGLSLAMIEAMLCGLPVVVTDVGDLGDLVEHGVNGYLLKDQTPGSFHEHLRNLLQNPGLRSRFGHKARQSAERCLVENISRYWGKILYPETVLPD